MLLYVKHWLRIFRAAGKYWSESNAFVYAAALAFFTVFSIAPMVIVAVAIVGIVLGEQAAQGSIMGHLEEAMGSQAAGFIQSAVLSSQIEQSGLLPGIMGIAAILFGATTVFAQMQRSLNDIWGVSPKPGRSGILLYLKTRLLSLTIVLSIGFILLVSLFLSIALRAFMMFAEGWLPLYGTMLIIFEAGLSIAMITLLFGAIFRILPDVLISWKDVIPGAFVTAILFTLGRSLIARYLANSATTSTYGAAGSLVLLLLWVNYSSLILLFGAAFSRAQLESSGKEVTAKLTAVKIQKKILEESD
jgi:membrane protein